MKKIFSFCLALLILLSIIPTSHAWVLSCLECGEKGTTSICVECPTCGETTYCELCGACRNSANHRNDASAGTDIVLKGNYTEAEYSVTVPAVMSPGDSSTVTATGHWNSDQILKVTAPNSVTLTYGTQSFNIGITFDGIERTGSDIDEITETASISVESKTVMFGTWTGVLEYHVELIDTIITFTVEDNGVFHTYQAKDGMTWTEWIDSDYNTDGMLFMHEKGYYPTTVNNQVLSMAEIGATVSGTEKIIANHSYFLCD